MINKQIAGVIPHHDGSDLYVSNSSPKIGENVTLKIRVPRDYSFEEAYIRVYEDAEPRILKLVEKSKNKSEIWL